MGLFARLFRRAKRQPDQDTLKMIAAVFARAFALEFVVKMCVSRQLIEIVRDPSDESEVKAAAGAIRSNVLDLAGRETARLPDKNFAAIAEPIVREVINNVYEISAKQVSASEWSIFHETRRAQHDDPHLHKLLDMIMADAFAARAFQVELLTRLASRESDPEQFVNTFIAGMHSRIDYNDSLMPKPSTQPQIHELARSSADQIGVNAIIELKGRK